MVFVARETQIQISKPRETILDVRENKKMNLN
jgi:hypothetical protein